MLAKSPSYKCLSVKIFQYYHKNKQNIKNLIASVTKKLLCLIFSCLFIFASIVLLFEIQNIFSWDQTQSFRHVRLTWVPFPHSYYFLVYKKPNAISQL